MRSKPQFMRVGERSMHTSASSERHAGVQSASRQPKCNLTKVSPDWWEGTMDTPGDAEVGLDLSKRGNAHVASTATPILQSNGGVNLGKLGGCVGGKQKLNTILEWDQGDGLPATRGFWDVGGFCKEQIPLGSPLSKPASGTPLHNFQESRIVRSDRPVRVAGKSLDKHGRGTQPRKVAPVTSDTLKEEEGSFGIDCKEESSENGIGIDECSSSEESSQVDEDSIPGSPTMGHQNGSGSSASSKEGSENLDPVVHSGPLDLGVAHGMQNSCPTDEEECGGTLPGSPKAEVQDACEAKLTNGTIVGVGGSGCRPKCTGQVEGSTIDQIEADLPPCEESRLQRRSFDQNPGNNQVNSRRATKRQKCVPWDSGSNGSLPTLATSQDLDPQRLENCSRGDASDRSLVARDSETLQKGMQNDGVEGDFEDRCLQPVPAFSAEPSSRDETLSGGADPIFTRGERKPGTMAPPDLTIVHERPPGSFGMDKSPKLVEKSAGLVVSKDSEEHPCDPNDRDSAELMLGTNSMSLSLSIGESEDLCGLNEVDSEPGHLVAPSASREERNEGKRREIDEFEIPLPEATPPVDGVMDDFQGLQPGLDHLGLPPAFGAIKRVFGVQNKSFDLMRFLESQGIVKDCIDK